MTLRLAIFLIAFSSWLKADPAIQSRTLEALVGEVLAHDPELKGMEADVEAAQGARRQAGFWKNPDLSVMYANRQLRMTGANSNGFSDSIGVTQVFEFPGKATLRKALADQDVTTAEIGLRQFRQALAGRVRLLGYRYALAEENRYAADLVAERSKELIALLEKRPKAGLQAMFDSGALSGNLAELAASERGLDQEALADRTELNLLRDWPADTAFTVILPDDRQTLPSDLNAFIVKSLGTSLILQLKKVDFAHSQKRLSASKLDVAPDFAIQPYYSLDKADDHDQKIGASLTVTLPVWNQNQGNIAAAKANVVKAEATIEQARQDLELSLTKLYQGRKLIGAQLQQVGPDTLRQLASLADLADRHYRLGAINLQTFLEAQRQYIATTQSVNQAILDDASASYDLLLLSGTMDVPFATGAKP